MIEYAPNLGRSPRPFRNVAKGIKRAADRAALPGHAAKAVVRGRKKIAHALAHRGPMAATVQLADYDGIGFSLKPPKKVRKALTAVKKAVTIKNVAKVAAIGAALVAAPVVLPALAHGAVAAGGALLKGGKAVASKVPSLLGRKASKTDRVPTQGPAQLPEIMAATISPPESSGGPAPAPAAIPAPAATAPAATEAAPAASSGGTYGGGDVAMPSAAPASAGGSQDETPQTAGASGGSSALPILLGAGVLLLVMSRKTRLRRA